MERSKEPVAMNTFLAEDVQMEVTAGHESEKVGTGADQRDMVRMGKRQEMRVSDYYAW